MKPYHYSKDKDDFSDIFAIKDAEAKAKLIVDALNAYQPAAVIEATAA